MTSLISAPELVAGLEAIPGAKSACSIPPVEAWLLRLGVALVFLLLLKTSLNLPAGDFERRVAALKGGCRVFALLSETGLAGSSSGVLEEMATE